MSNVPVAFLVLGTFFFVYFVAALWRSRPIDFAAGRARLPRGSWLSRIRRALRR